MPYPQNNFQNVQTYQNAMLLALQNEMPVVANANKKFDNFQNLVANLGTTVLYKKPGRVTTSASLVWDIQGINQRTQSLTVDQPVSSAVEITDPQALFNMDVADFMKDFGDDIVTKIGAQMETYASLDFIKHPYRFYGDPNQPISTFKDLARAVTMFKNYGSAKRECFGFIPDMSKDNIINSGQNQFTPERNNENAQSWELGSFSQTKWMTSSLLQSHLAGSEGQAGTTLTVVSTTKDASGNITAITFSGCSAASDADSVKQYDRFYSTDATNFMLQFSNYQKSANPIQFQASADAASNGSSRVTVTLKVPLYPGQSVTDSVAINNDIVAGMTFKVVDSHTAGCIYSGDPHMFASPMMGSQDPFASWSETDPKTGMGISFAAGAFLGQGKQAVGGYGIYGSTFTPEYGMTLLFPYNPS